MKIFLFSCTQKSNTNGLQPCGCSGTLVYEKVTMLRLMSLDDGKHISIFDERIDEEMLSPNNSERQPL